MTFLRIGVKCAGYIIEQLCYNCNMKKQKSGITIHELVIQSALGASLVVVVLILGLSDNFSTIAASQSADCRVSALYPSAVRQWCNLITYYADQHQLSPDLIAAVIWMESGGNALAYSHSGAVGLMQVMPRDGLAAAFICQSGPCFANRPTRSELEDPDFNISYGTRMLAGLYERTGSLREALKAYGPMDVGYSYADRIIDIFQRYKSE